MGRKKKMLLWILLAAFVALVVFVPLVGFLMPSEYRAQGRVDVALPPEEVWAALVDFERHPHSASMCRGVERLPDEDGRAVWIEDIGSTRLRNVRMEESRPRRLVTAMSDTATPMTARWEIELEPLDGGSRIYVTNETRIPRGTWHVPLFRLIMTLTRGHEKGVEAYLSRAVDGMERVSWSR